MKMQMSPLIMITINPRTNYYQFDGNKYHIGYTHIFVDMAQTKKSFEN